MTWCQNLISWSAGDLERLAGTVRRALALPPTRFALELALSSDRVGLAEEGLRAAALEGWSPAQAAALLESVAAAKILEARRLRTDLVWSQPHDEASRNTDLVIAELAGEAQEELLVSTLSIGHHRGPNPALVPIAARMVALPDLKVRLFVNVKGTNKEGVPANPREHFLSGMRRYWPPGPPLPEIWFAPMSLLGEDGGCLHAKCVVADRRRAFVTSANLTESAQAKNIEAGAIIDDPTFAKRLVEHFDGLIARGVVERLA